MKLLAGIALGVMSVSLLCAQQQNRSETTAEQEYLSNVESVIISELALADDRDTKLVALEYAQIAVDEGRVSESIRQTIVDLAGEGTLSVSTMNGRVVNNFPDVRMQACELLGKIPSKESKEALKKIAYAESEAVVAASAVRALGEIGLNDNNDTVETIMWVQKKYAILQPTSSLAYAVLEAFEKLAPSVTDPLGKGQMVQSITEISRNYQYVKPVRDKALALLKTIR
jgi:HEAT repeat protein